MLALQKPLGGLFNGDVVEEPLVAVSAALHVGATAASAVVSLDELAVADRRRCLLAGWRGGSAVAVGGHLVTTYD